MADLDENPADPVLTALAVGDLDKNPAVPVVKALAVGNLDKNAISTWDAETIRREINTIYARSGVVFPNYETQAYFEAQPWYRSKPSLTFEEAEEYFSPDEKIDIERLAQRRSILTEEP